MLMLVVAGTCAVNVLWLVHIGGCVLAKGRTWKLELSAIH